jgi:hypothetical protein
MGYFREFDDEADRSEDLLGDQRAEHDAMDALERLGDRDSADGEEWVELGMQDVPVADLPDPEGISDARDFSKVTPEEMQAGLLRMEEMRPTIASGEGASKDYWAEVDQRLGLPFTAGYQKIYEAFYGDDAIKLTKVGDTYDITNGRHRIWLAQRMGIETLPARVTARRSG